MGINEIVYDTGSKEYVRISNGVEKEGVFYPTEAQAIRFVGMKCDGQEADLAFTYRSVDWQKLDTVTNQEKHQEEWRALFDTRNVGKFRFWGRI